MTEDELRIYVVVRKDLEITKGKFGGQVAHAAMSAWANCIRINSDRAWNYFSLESQAKIVLQVKDLPELLKTKAKLENAGHYVALIKDMGRTEFNEPTVTCLGIGPLYANTEANPLLKRLQLYKEPANQFIYIPVGTLVWFVNDRLELEYTKIKNVSFYADEHKEILSYSVDSKSHWSYDITKESNLIFFNKEEAEKASLDRRNFYRKQIDDKSN